MNEPLVQCTGVFYYIEIIGDTKTPTLIKVWAFINTISLIRKILQYHRELLERANQIRGHLMVA
ncbi:hypothetical protein JOD17_000877 [Geomicrobium sediminis]|uniref:Uncharacterized protein n=1 Tax=Geomicrobium sediminis TaxID=1347788 RepID=A0ABS2P8Q6_9BACL|nr:hypothetical protein [Geomicrobium sediminis]